MASEHPANGPAQPPAALRVLVVDDNRDAADSLAEMFRLYHHDVRVCYHGAAALDACTAFRPQVVFLDLGMARLDGYQVAKRLRTAEELAGLVLVALTGFADPEHRERARDHFDHYLLKPAEPAELLTLLASVAARPAGRSGPHG
jgi:CheY-like chemotaxis protein